MFGIVWQSLGTALQKLVCSGLQELSERESPLQGIIWTLSKHNNKKTYVGTTVHPPMVYIHCIHYTN